MKTAGAIANLFEYNLRMAKSVLDKLFFVDKVDVHTLIDFGCADGTLLGHVAKWMPDAELIGYDKDPLMIKEAKAKHKGVFFADNLLTALSHRCGKRGDAALLLSSVIHEVYHYSTPEEIEEFWRMVWSCNVKYIIIRDMMPSRSVDRTSDIDDVVRVMKAGAVLDDFQRIWGSVENNKNLLHFLLKYKYVEPNWNREVKENYIPLYREDFLRSIPNEYSVLYQEHYVLPWLKTNVRKDFGIVWKDPTHFKIILERQ